MAKLKFWKKRVLYPKNISYINKKGEYIEIIGFKDKSWDVIGFGKKWFKKDFKSKSQAIKFTNKYMNEHDRS